MLTALQAQNQILGRAVAAMAWALIVGLLSQCYQAPSASNVADFTSTPIASPGAAQGPNTANAGNTTTQSPAPSNGNAPTDIPQNVGTLTISPASNPYICLGVTRAAAGAQATLTTCNGSSLQKWLLQNTKLKAASNLCLSFSATGSAALKTTPILAACNSNEVTQNVMRGSSGGLAMNSFGSNFGLAAQVPVASNSNITFENLDASQVAQRWILGADNVQQNKLQQGGFAITAQDANNSCLTATQGLANYAPCSSASAAQQSFRWNDSAQIVANGNCLTSVAAGPCKLSACDSQDANQRWSSITGHLTVSGGLGCLNTTDGSMSSCPADNSLTFTFGAPQAM